MNKPGFFTEKDGKRSMTRLLSFLCFFLLAAVDIITVLSMFANDHILDFNGLMFLIVFNALFMIGMFVPKQLNKISEIKGIIELAKNPPSE